MSIKRCEAGKGPERDGTWQVLSKRQVVGGVGVMVVVVVVGMVLGEVAVVAAAAIAAVCN